MPHAPSKPAGHVVRGASPPPCGLVSWKHLSPVIADGAKIRIPKKTNFPIILNEMKGNRDIAQLLRRTDMKTRANNYIPIHFLDSLKIDKNNLSTSTRQIKALPSPGLLDFDSLG